MERWRRNWGPRDIGWLAVELLSCAVLADVVAGWLPWPHAQTALALGLTAFVHHLRPRCWAGRQRRRGRSRRVAPASVPTSGSSTRAGVPDHRPGP